MKKMILLGILFLSLKAFGQDFPGKDIQLLMGKELKVIKIPESLYERFYSDDKLKKKLSIRQNNIPKSEYLVGKIFTLISYEPYNDNLGSEKFKIKIENSETGIIYYDYDPSLELFFPFEVIGGLDYPDGFFCKDIKESKDKFTDEIKYSSSESDGISFSRIKKGNATNTFLSVNVAGSTVNVNIKGVILLLENGFRIDRPDAEIDVKVSSRGSGYIYSAFMDLEANDIILLTQNKITDVRLYIYDNSITNGKKLLEYLKCIINK